MPRSLTPRVIRGRLIAIVKPERHAQKTSQSSWNRPDALTAIARYMPVIARLSPSAPATSAAIRQMFSMIGAAAAAAKRDIEFNTAANNVARLISAR